MATEARAIVVAGTATELRRRLGATAWVVLEELLVHSTGAGSREATASVRALAAALGVSKDTIARALARLRDAGIVTALQARSSTGTFRAGRYRIAVPPCIMFTAAAAPTVVTPRPKPLASHAPIVQRSLFDSDLATP